MQYADKLAVTFGEVVPEMPGAQHLVRRMSGRALPVVCALALIACQPATPAAPPAGAPSDGDGPVSAAAPLIVPGATDDAGEPTGPSREPLDGCEWELVAAPGFSLFAQQCTFDDGSTLEHSVGRHLGKPALIETYVSEDTSSARAVVVLLDVPTGFSPAGDLIPYLASIGAAPANPACVVLPFDSAGAPDRFELTLSGSALEAFRNEIEAPLEGYDDSSGSPDALSDAQIQPCGPFGLGYASERIFRKSQDRPETLVWIDYGSGPPAFDPETLTLDPPPSAPTP